MLAEDTLRRVVRELVLREDANDDPASLERRLESGLDAVRRGTVVLLHHPDDGSLSWVRAEDLPDN